MVNWSVFSSARTPNCCVGVEIVTITPPSRVYLFSRGSNPELLRGSWNCYHYNTQPTYWSTSAAGARTLDCCIVGEEVANTFTPPSRQTGRPTAASWYRIPVYFYFLIWNYRLSSWNRASWYSILGLRSWLLPICWYIATDLLSSKLAPIVSSHCFAVLFGFILTLAVVQHQHQELSLVISVINISFKSVLKVNLFSYPWFLTR